MKTPRVLFTASTASHILSFHLPYLRRFRELGYEVDVACGAPAEDIPFASQVIPLPFQKKMTSPANLRAAALLRRHLQKTPYALIVTHTSLAAFFTRLASGGKDRPPLVNMVHGYLFDGDTPGPKDKLLLAAERYMAARTDLVLAMNRPDLATAQRHRLGAQVAYVPGVGVDFSRLEPGLAEDRSALRLAQGIPENAFVLLYAAEFSPRKNQAVLLRALAHLPQRVHLVLAGQGALLDSCKTLARQLGVEHRVSFPGQVGDMGRWYALSNAAVSASRSEGLPFNIMEGMYAALPVVASAVRGHTDLIVSGQTGLLYPCGDVSACAQAVQSLVEYPALCAQLGRAAFAAVQPYALPQVLPHVMAQYQALLPSGVPTPASV